ncbi:MAG TPA: universal stress protein [Acidimicrobiales bacterium]
MQAPFTDVLVPLDGSPTAELALRPAFEVVRRTGVPLRLLTAALPGDEGTFDPYLSELASRYADVATVETAVVEADGAPDAIVGQMLPHTLVCMSSHGRSGVARAVLGSVAETVLREVAEPALIVGPGLRDDPLFEGRIVACVDGSPESERTLGPAKQWSEVLGLPLWIMQVGEPVEPADWASGGDAHEGGHLAQLAARLGGVAGWDVLHGHDASRSLVDMASSEVDRTALLVMATHGRTGWDRLRLGSVTASTVRAATVPVLVVPAAARPATDG